MIKVSEIINSVRFNCFKFLEDESKRNIYVCVIVSLIEFLDHDEIIKIDFFKMSLNDFCEKYASKGVN